MISVCARLLAGGERGPPGVGVLCCDRRHEGQERCDHHISCYTHPMTPTPSTQGLDSLYPKLALPKIISYDGFDRNQWIRSGP